jgi:indole-3-glycerol phosphate synthase
LNILDKIVEVKKEEVKKLRQDYSFSKFADSPYFLSESLSFSKSITQNKNISIIAEIKKASPSKGILLENFNHITIAKEYFSAEINAISVLTDKNFFKGDILFLKDIAGIKEKPLLRKDFIIDIFQIYEAKANGADAVLLISEILSSAQIKELTCAAKETGLEVLLELHSSEMLEKIEFSVNTLIGINNRNLEDFITDLNTTIEIAALLPDYVTIVSESGVSTEEDVKQLKQTKTRAILAGEYFMKSDNISAGIKELKKWCRIES